MGSLKAVAIISGNENVTGSVQFLQDSNGVTHVKGKIMGLKPGRHGFHIHALGDTTNGCNSTGPHFNPLKNDHGAPTDQNRHAGDLGNVIAGADGVAEFSMIDMQIPLSGQHSILGRAVVVHADPDDLGRGYGEKMVDRELLQEPLYAFKPARKIISSFQLLHSSGHFLTDQTSHYATGGHELSKTTGNAGARVGCGIIGLQSSV